MAHDGGFLRLDPGVEIILLGPFEDGGRPEEARPPEVVEAAIKLVEEPLAWKAL